MSPHRVLLQPFRIPLWDKKIEALLILRSYSKFWTFFVVSFVLDLVTKSWVVENAHALLHNPIVVFDWLDGHEAFFEITYVTNPGAAWSMFSDYPEILTILAFVALVSVFLFRRNLELKKSPNQWMLGLICGGILGNLSDRLFREPAEVVDFIDIFLPVINYDYPIFNVADSSIFLGAIFYFFHSLNEAKREQKLARQDTTSE